MTQMIFGLGPFPKKTRKELLLEEVNEVAPWSKPVALIQPHAGCAPDAGWSTTVSH